MNTSIIKENEIQELPNIIRNVLEDRTDIQYVPNLCYPIANKVVEYEAQQRRKFVIDILKEVASIKLGHTSVGEMLLAFKITEKIQEITERYNISMEEITND